MQETKISPTEKNGKSSSEQKQEEYPKVPYSWLFRYATTSDKVLMTIGSIAAIINGFAFPAWSFVYGQMIDSFSPVDGFEGLIHNAGVQAMWFAIIGGISFVLSMIQLSCWMTSGERQAICYRRNYFQALLKQEVGWFDKCNPNELSTKIATECLSIQGAIGDKVPTFIMTLAMFFAGFIVAYIRGWLMSLVVTATIPVMMIGGMIVGIVMKKGEQINQIAYAGASGSAEQCLNAIKTVKSLNGEEHEMMNYSQRLIQSFKANVKYGAFSGFGVGLTVCCMFLAYSLSFWYGGKLIMDGTENTMYDRSYTSGDVMTCFFSILTGGFSLGQAVPCIKEFIKGQMAAVNVFAVIDRIPSIQNCPSARIISQLQGKIQFKNVIFSYPMKPDLKALDDVSLQILPNQKTAIVGESGSGKSTIMQLIERFYDPSEGQITIDGVEIKHLDLKWIRNQIGYVGQEPVLFAATIRENLQFGNSEATEEEMIDALRQANAWSFVQKLELKLDTYVGNMGNQFSGGQKQRICIARAILKNPKILLLDEATSALDRKNEKEIQETLDNVSSGRTTLVIAHRLSTVKNASRIIVVDQGKIVEQGEFSELIQIQSGKFAGMIKNESANDNPNNQQINANTIENKNTFMKDNLENDKFQKRNVKQNNTNNNHVIIDITNDQQISEIPQKVELEQAQSKKEQMKKTEMEDKAFATRLFQMNKPEQGWFYLGVLVTLVNGTLFPLAGLILGEFITILSNPLDSDFRDKVNALALYFLIISLASLLLYIIQIYLFNRVGEGLTLRLRQDAYKKIMRMPCSWFDEAENAPGILTSRLAADCQKINILTTNVMSLQFQNLSCFISGLIIAFVASWRVTLVALGMMPVMIIIGSLQAYFVQGWSEETDKVYKGSNNIVTDAVTNIRTVVSFANEHNIMAMFEHTLQHPASLIKKKACISGLMFGLSQLSMFSIYAVIFYVSAYFVRDYGLEVRDMYVSMLCILFAGFGAGSNNAFVGDVATAKVAARNIFKILDAEDESDIQLNIHKSQNLKLNTVGQIVFDNVSFKYPSRDALVLRSLSFSINSGQHVALVGPSGCGKSSIMQILLRFYDSYTGTITINGVDIRQYDIASLRSNFGVVFQDAILFDTTFKENIAYNTADSSMQDITKAAANANALSFIQGDQQQEDKSQFNKNTNSIMAGFERRVGIKGSQISGGQKQRVAIARAILKMPKIMLLDEATSALDQENEILVQSALDNILVGKTSIQISHRMNTIKNSDVIFVINDGQIIELGTYDQLMKAKGFFFNINNL